MNVLLSDSLIVFQSTFSTSGIRSIWTLTSTYFGPDPYGPSFGVIDIFTTFSPLGLVVPFYSSSWKYKGFSLAKSVLSEGIPKTGYSPLDCDGQSWSKMIGPSVHDISNSEIGQTTIYKSI